MKLRLGVGEAIIGINKPDHKPNPELTFRQGIVEGVVGRTIEGRTLTPPDFTLEIVGLDGLVVLEEMIRKAREVLEQEEQFLITMVNIENLLSKYE